MVQSVWSAPPPKEVTEARKIITDALLLLSYADTCALANAIKAASASVLLGSFKPEFKGKETPPYPGGVAEG